MSTSISEKERIINVVFLSEIAEEHQDELLILDRKYVNMEEFICTRIDGSVQSESV